MDPLIIHLVGYLALLKQLHLTLAQSGSGEALPFCYLDSSCGPNSESWASLCRTGRSQSPINLPGVLVPTGKKTLNVHAYKGKSFRIQNNGHTVQIDFNNQGPSTQLLTFPDPLTIGPGNKRQYRFASAHFHWGMDKKSVGSEHCIAGKCSAMELHLVHYLASYPSQAAAVASGDPNALAVIGVLIDRGLVTPKSPLGSISRNLRNVMEPDATRWTVVNERLDLSLLLFEASFLNYMYTYKGSLTTPGCNEQVNWYVMKRRVVASKGEIEAFRTMVRDRSGMALRQNHRPLQNANGRKVLLTQVVAY